MQGGCRTCAGKIQGGCRTDAGQVQGAEAELDVGHDMWGAA